MNKIVALLLLSFGLTITASAQQQDSLVAISIDLNKTYQTIENIGSSGCWFSEGIGKYWPVAKRERIAEMLFSQELDAKGQPKGIGLSAWRFNIGAGTLEQGDASGIKDFRRRADGFLNADGSYDLTKQAGYRFFSQKAKDYGVETLIAFSNSPPVQFTKNKLGYKTEKDYRSNLREDAYGDYAKFLTKVIKHFDEQKLHFDYISPVNEPQWDWSHKYMEAHQEGSPWSNEEIYKITKALNTELGNERLTSKILVTEAGMLNYLYGGSGHAANQIQTFFNPKSPLYLGSLQNVPKIVAGHGYFTESNDSVLFDIRKHLADTAKVYGVKYWQSEYSMLADGFKEGNMGDRTAMDCAIFLSKVIHADLTVGNATAWQFWNAYEPGSAEKNTRYYLIALQGNPDFKDGSFQDTKNLWALGHYSRFIRPGMIRVEMQQDGKLKNNQLMISAFKNLDGKLVVVATNAGREKIRLKMNILNAKKYSWVSRYLTTADLNINMLSEVIKDDQRSIILPARSISTFVMD
ncbi:beta-glycosidase [Pedobacter frigidisoli]|uniref:Beta-glycosidase n=1 Tax=Pedobacter frigidisoli TaxID=2530455 RepID=A0A4R0P2G5_9SPHI|nr:glycoside hydrolase [Pedobacter frigidisoli]TCD07588.1 beta-glycosidase [Pedobacter frigidisoli]